MLTQAGRAGKNNWSAYDDEEELLQFSYNKEEEEQQYRDFARKHSSFRRKNLEFASLLLTTQSKPKSSVQSYSSPLC